MGKKRAIAIAGTKVPLQRKEIFSQAFSWINLCNEFGFYIEAISIIESLISDRMESRLIYLGSNNPDFESLGHLIKNLKKFETNEEINRIIEDIDGWRKNRNITIHEMVKMEANKFKPWLVRVSDNKEIARDGLKLLRKLDNLLTKDKRKKG